MTATPTFDLRKPVRERNLEYLIVMPLLAGCLIFLGWWLIPDTFVWELSGNAIESMTTSSFFGIGIGLCVAGIFHFAKAIVHFFSFIGAMESGIFALPTTSCSGMYQSIHSVPKWASFRSCLISKK